MRTNYAISLSLILAHEGGYVNHPKDPGGPTNKGITQRVYDAYRKSNDWVLRPVEQINDEEVSNIYRNQYWGLTCDKLPSGFDYAVFDYSVNSGASRAIKDLQRCLNVTVDGVLGNGTLQAIAGINPVSLINAYCDRRLAFLRSLSTFDTFGKGWTRRVEEVRANAIKMLGLTIPARPVVPAPAPAPYKAVPPPPAAAAKVTIAATSVAVVSSGAIKASQHIGILPVIVALLALSAGVAAYWFFVGRGK